MPKDETINSEEKQSGFEKTVMGEKSPMVFVLAMILITVIIYVVYITFNFVAFFGSMLLIFCIVAIHPGVVEKLRESTSIQYYAVYIVAILMFSLDIVKESKELLALLITAIIVSMISFYVQSKWTTLITMMINFYLVLRIFIMFII